MRLDTITPVQLPVQRPVADAPGSPGRLKFRIRFRKAGDLRFVSHHDLMHLLERTFRRADLHLHVSQGFNPRPRMWFALSLALGIAGLNEVLEIEVADAMDADEVERRLIAHCPPGIDILSVRLIEPRAAARVRRSWYRINAACGLALTNESASAKPQAALAEFLARPDCWIERTRTTRRRVNLRPFVSELVAHDNAIEMALWISPKGAARPDEIVAALGLSSWLEAGGVIERFDLEIIDELPPGTDGPPALEDAFGETPSNDTELAEEAHSSRPTAIISNPLSFET